MDNYLSEIMDSVSSGDAGSSVSGNDVYYQIEIYTVSGSDAGPQYTLFNKPLEEYSTTEGLLLILVILAVVYFVKDFIKEGFKWLSW